MTHIGIVGLFVLTIFSACTENTEGSGLLATSGNLVDFEQYVQPLLEVGCASLDCHGDPGRPLRFFARAGLRMTVGLRGEPISEAELVENMLSIGGIDPRASQIEDNLLLIKPLAIAAGGIHHIGGDIWDNQNNSVYRCLHSWLRSGVGDIAGREICTEVSP